MSLLNVDQIDTVNPVLPVNIQGASFPQYQGVPMNNPPTPTGTTQTAVSMYAGLGAPNNANGVDGNFYFRSDGGALTTIYHKRAGAWVGIV